jgi:hypothetical protein
MCFAGFCDFTACDGKDCGTDGCGATCGDCGAGKACVQGKCPPKDKQCEDNNTVPFDGCNAGALAELQVNEFAAGDQAGPDVAMLGDGGFVVAWESDGQDGQGTGVFARVFAPDGGGPKPEFQVNQETWGAQRHAAVAGLPGGGFVVTWTSSGQDGFLEGVYARVFSGDGGPDGDEFQVNSTSQMNQVDPSIAVAGEGFVAVWQSDGQDTSGTGVFGQRFAADGTPDGPEFQVNTYFLANQGAPEVAGFLDGSFLVTWASFQQDGSDWGVFARHLLPDGSMDWQEFQVNSSKNGNQTDPVVAVTGTNAYVIAWQSLGQDAADAGVFSQRFKLPGAKQGTETAVNTTAGQAEGVPSAAGEEGGRFVVAWTAGPATGQPETAGQDGDGEGVFFQRYKSDGTKTGAETQLNTFVAGDQGAVAAAMAKGGSMVLAYESCPAASAPESGQDSDGCGVFVQRLDPDGNRLYQ